MQIKFKQSAYLNLKYISIQDVIDGHCTPMMAGADGSGYFESQGYVRIGTANVTLEISSEDEIASHKIAALQSQLQTVRAENQQRENAILDQISKLTAISHDAK